MKLTTRATNAYKAFVNNNIEKTQNSNRGNASDFLNYGNRSQALYQDWSQVEMSDQDMYTGYSYAAIKKRANRASALGKKFLYTDAAPALMKKAKENETELEHPYLKLIRQSKEFSRRKFWHDISTYLDLEGVYYLMAVRAIKVNSKGETQVGEIQKFQMLNPYQVRRVTKQSDGTLGGYIESKDGLYREIPKEMIIEIRLLNPFDNDKAYSMTDAAKESQFTMKQAGDYTRHSIKGNINAPGAISTAVELEEHVFDNFVSRVQNHSKGEPLYGNGTGAINWNSMQIDLDKAGLDKINEINRAVLFAVSGTSKTTLGIEESGTTRDTSETQKDNFTEDAVMPQVEDILDALNLDYRQWYPQWEQDEYEITLDNPLATNREAELADIEIRQTELDLRDALVAKGYEYEIAAKYAHGDITLEELGEPTLEPEMTPQEVQAAAQAQLGQTPAAGPNEEPTQGNEGEVVNPSDAAQTPAENRVLSINKMVDPKVNEKKVKEAVKQLKSQPKTETTPLKGKDAKDAADDSEEIIDEEEEKKQAVSKDDKKKKKTKVTVELENSLENKVMNQVSIRDNFPDLYEGLVIEPRAVTDDKYRGCIMINTEKIPVTQFVKNGEADLLDATTRHDHTMGAVGEVEPHATLLYGLLNNGNIWKKQVDQVLSGWKMPTVKIKEVSFFQLEDGKAVIGLLEETPEIVDANQRLSLLPHLNTFSEYHPHVTLAYITNDADETKWVKALGKKYNGQVVATNGLNYGDELEEDDSDDDTPTHNHVEDEHDMENLPKAKKVVKKKIENSPETLSEAPHEHSHDEHEHTLNSTLIKAQNALDPAVRKDALLQESSLQNGIVGIEADIVNAAIEKLNSGEYQDGDPIVTPEQESNIVGVLAVLIAGYFLSLIPIYAAQLFLNRLAAFGKQGVFAMTDEVEEYISMSARQAAESHVSTVISDVTNALKESQDDLTEDQVRQIITDKVQQRDEKYLKQLPENPNSEDIDKAIKLGKFDNDPAYKTARDQIRNGEGLNQVVKRLQETYTNMSKTRAKTIATHEANRVFNMSQYQADLQFLKESNNLDKAYKRLVSRRVSGEPCPVCSSLIAKTRLHPIPFAQNFADLGSELTASYKKKNGKMAVQKVPISYEAIKAGNVHVNCNCEYELVIKNDDGTFKNELDGISLNNIVDEHGNIHSAEDGKFTKKPGIKGVDPKTGMGKVDLSGKAGVNMDFEQAKEDATTMSRREFKDKYLPSLTDPKGFKDFVNDTLEGKPSEDEQAIAEILSYQANSQHLNRHLAEHPDSRFKEGMTKDLDKAFTWETTKPAVTYRKLGKDYYNIVDSKDGYKFTELNYGSSSINPGEADSGAWGDGPILVIDMPKGQKLAVPDLYSGTVDDFSIYGQQELIMPRDTEYEVLDKVKIPESDEYMIKVRIVK